MTSIWAKDVNGKWEVFPAHMLETFGDGKQGVSDSWCFLGLWPWHLTAKWNHLFTYDAVNSRFLLKEQPENEEMSEKIQAGPGVF